MQVNITKRIDTPEGKRYCPVVVGPNGRIKPDWVMDNAVGRFDEGLQRLYMEFCKGQHENWQTVQANLKGQDFFRPGPLRRAIECDRPCVLLIDELDKVEDGFEAMLLEILSAWQLSEGKIAIRMG